MEQSDNHKALVLTIGLAIQNCKVLRDKMLEYCKIENKTHRSNVLMDFVRRIHANLYSVAILSRESIKHGDSTMLKLPMGLILRNCFMDSLYAIYLSSLDEAQFEEEVTVLNKDYAFSLPSRKDVWIDKAHELGIDGLEYWYDDLIVDNFNQYFAEYTIEPTGDWSYEFIKNSDIRESLLNKGISIERESRKLMEHKTFGPIVKSIFSYYKYFSQYEHFSEHAHGDTLAPFYEDNVSFPAAIKALNRGVRTILEQVDIRICLHDKIQ